ncbi:MAG TPA: roadblock/LC7 domain-containing protein [Thermoflexia bacterium]|jgi:predicted regulator of Ras-like GTPase activity (Roadblock/LC7/MglB family)|nr:roadblock/LC7 domain-containing protein [Thermoflexia bacterium]
MGQQIALPEELAAQIEQILSELRIRAQVDCVLLADISGQLIASQGEVEGLDPVLVAALAAGELAAMTELTHQIGEKSPTSSFLHEGEKKSLYISDVAGTFILIVAFPAGVPVGLVRLFIRRAVERLRPLAAEFEDMIHRARPALGADFGAALSGELDRILGEM